MAAPLYPPKNIGSITYVYNNKTFTAVWPYFTYDSKGLNALQKEAMPGGNLDLNAGVLASAIQAVLDKFDNDAGKKEAADRKAINDAAYAAAAALTYAEMAAYAAANAPTTVINVSNPVVPAIKSFTANKPILATKVVVTTAKLNSKKSIKSTPKKPTTTKQSSPGKNTPNKNPAIPPPPPPDIKVSLCLPGEYLDKNTSRCKPCPTGPMQYITGSGCSPCPPGTTGESIHTGCSQVGPDGKSYTFIV